MIPKNVNIMLTVAFTGVAPKQGYSHGEGYIEHYIVVRSPHCC